MSPYFIPCCHFKKHVLEQIVSKLIFTKQQKKINSHNPSGCGLASCKAAFLLFWNNGMLLHKGFNPISALHQDNIELSNLLKCLILLKPKLLILYLLTLSAKTLMMLSRCKIKGKSLSIMLPASLLNAEREPRSSLYLKTKAHYIIDFRPNFRFKASLYSQRQDIV